MDMVESNDRVHISIDMPGLTAKNISVILSGNMLYIKTNRNDSKKDNDDSNYKSTNEIIYTSERSTREWARYVRLPLTANTNRITSTYKNGVLFIQAPIVKYGDIERTIPVIQG